ncbi:hypothetical protein O181_073137 [Austropuccinia psidii MF-1]|uniref:Uncharacterized protein n=1 Tax=Austropuccinia psidii MF-1 TaxID=1389203 RepID=A0A9Q3F8G3_9BASI|nr:hypothetical protein [Austropuccinia psidii MF-1]
MTAGEGQPNNWLNGIKDEEYIISNPSKDGGEAQSQQISLLSGQVYIMSRLSDTTSEDYGNMIFKPNIPEINTSPTTSTYKNKNNTPTSYYLLNYNDTSSSSDNLDITVGQATGNVIDHN